MHHPITMRLVILSGFMFSAACGILPEGDPNGIQAADPNATGGGTTGGTTGGTAAVTYAADVAPLLMSNCNICHGVGGANQSLFDCSTQASVTAAADAMKSAVDSGQMPPTGALSDTDKATIDNWIAGGKQ